MATTPTNYLEERRSSDEFSGQIDPMFRLRDYLHIVKLRRGIA